MCQHARRGDAGRRVGRAAARRPITVQVDCAQQFAAWCAGTEPRPDGDRSASLIDKLDRPPHVGRRGRQRVGGVPEERRRGEARAPCCGRPTATPEAAAAARAPAAVSSPLHDLGSRSRRHFDRSSTAINNGSSRPPSDLAAVAPRADPSTGGFVQADPATNSLIITAPEPLYRQVARGHRPARFARRAQVYIESADRRGLDQRRQSVDFGIQWQGILASANSSSNGNLLGGGTNFGTTGNLLNIINWRKPASSPTALSSSSTTVEWHQPASLLERRLQPRPWSTRSSAVTTPSEPWPTGAAEQHQRHQHRSRRRTW